MLEKEIGDYRVISPLGDSGSVYLAEHKVHSEKVAIKVLPPKMLGNRQVEEHLKKLCQLDNDHIVKTIEVIHHNDRPYLATKFVDGETLKASFAQPNFRARRWQSSVDLILQVLRAIEYAHKLGIHHFNIRPSNILIHNETVKIKDFGMHEAFSLAGLTKPSHNSSDIDILKYLSPQQIKGSKATAQSDLYSATFILYELLCGNGLYAGWNIPDLCDAKRKAIDPIPPARRVPRELEVTLRKKLSSAPDIMMPDVRDYIQSLEDIRHNLDLKEEDYIRKDLNKPHEPRPEEIHTRPIPPGLEQTVAEPNFWERLVGTHYSKYIIVILFIALIFSLSENHSYSQDINAKNIEIDAKKREIDDKKQEISTLNKNLENQVQQLSICTQKISPPTPPKAASDKEEIAHIKEEIAKLKSEVTDESNKLARQMRETQASTQSLERQMSTELTKEKRFYLEAQKYEAEYKYGHLQEINQQYNDFLIQDATGIKSLNAEFDNAEELQKHGNDMEAKDKFDHVLEGWKQLRNVPDSAKFEQQKIDNAYFYLINGSWSMNSTCKKNEISDWKVENMHITVIWPTQQQQPVFERIMARRKNGDIYTVTEISSAWHHVYRYHPYAKKLEVENITTPNKKTLFKCPQ